MRLINQTQSTILATNVSMANNPLKRIKGLLGKKNFLRGEALIIKPCNSVHTFFMHFSIDLLFVNKDYKIIKVLPAFAPNKISGIYWKSSLVIELPCGTINLTKTQNKDQLQLEK